MALYIKSGTSSILQVGGSVAAHVDCCCGAADCVTCDPNCDGGFDVVVAGPANGSCTAGECSALAGVYSFTGPMSQSGGVSVCVIDLPGLGGSGSCEANAASLTFTSVAGSAPYSIIFRILNASLSAIYQAQVSQMSTFDCCALSGLSLTVAPSGLFPCGDGTASISAVP